MNDQKNMSAEELKAADDAALQQVPELNQRTFDEFMKTPEMRRMRAKMYKKVSRMNRPPANNRKKTKGRTVQYAPAKVAVLDGRVGIDGLPVTTASNSIFKRINHKPQ